jgi:hypothetical protein
MMVLRTSKAEVDVHTSWEARQSSAKCLHNSAKPGGTL